MRMFTPPEVEDEVFLSFGHAIARNATALVRKPALILGDHQVSWAEFGDRVARTAGRLAAAGQGPGTMVASLSENSAEHVVLYCAVVAVGACIVPLPVSATGEALQRMVADCGAELLFASASQRPIADQMGDVQVIDLDQLSDWVGKSAPAAPAEVTSDDFFNVIYSSGTTGLPKGIVHDHRFRSRQLARIGRFGVTAEARMIISTPLYSNTTLFGMLPAIMLGATLVVMTKFDTLEFLELSQRHKLTHATLVPVQYTRLMAEPRFDEYDLSSYSCKFSTSAPLPPALIAQVIERWPGNLIEVYGMTEGGLSTALNCRDFPDKWDTVGRPGDGVDMRVIDDTGAELPPGGYGEVVGRSGSMMPAYLNLPDKSAELLWRSPQGEDFIRSGDMGRFDADGFLHLLDRKKDMIISGGFNIYAADLEAVLHRHPDVADAAVIAVPSEAWGETPLAFVVLRPGADCEAEVVKGWANAQLGKTQRISAVEVCTDLPRSEIGKVLKRELRAPYWKE
ncbi:class I adenylate-forming enzyme family protein [Pseudooceanicola spongiae]|uniref:AMP-binding protein n=1 Tax=Pseudooceanicola spongiae TaxID=2613965 RepID=A0A7M3V2T8_9RHOB|nr:class I adenylate-forming enzyme family protein [Pseudooceanicola spongiae]QOL79401.1 AMP-binding protein [Pseudooceanicola spongiae]